MTPATSAKGRSLGVPPIPPGKMTYEEFLEWAPEGLRAEWVDGEVVLMSPANWRHQDISAFLTALLRIFVRKRGLGRVIAAPFQIKGGPTLPGREPDLIYISNESVSRLKHSYLEGPCDLAIEIISPDSQTRDREQKLGEYERAGIREYWIIDPERNEMEAHSLGADGMYKRLIPDAQNRVHSEALPGLWFDIGWLLEDPLPDESEILRAWGAI